MVLHSIRTGVGAAVMAAILAGCATSGISPASGQGMDIGADRSSIEGGRSVAENLCSSCHAVGRTGESPDPAAPAFRNLHERYRFDVLQEELAAGVHVGQARMPQFQLDLETTDALIAYLRDIQGSEARP